MKSNDCLLEDGDLQLSLTPSNLVAVNNHLHPNLLSHERLCIVNASLITDTYAISSGLIIVRSDNALDSLNNSNSLSSGLFEVRFDTDFEFERSTAIGVDGFSQSNACIATRFEECSLTMLDRLWYLYSYIYNQVSSNTPTIIIPILLFIVVAILMATTDHPTTSSHFVSPSPHLSRSGSFTMTNYTPINDWSFKFSNHPIQQRFSHGLNDTYSENFDDATIATFFTTPARTVVAPNSVTLLQTAIVDTVLLTSNADCTVVAPIFNQMLLFASFGNPPGRYPIRTTASLTTIFDATIAANHTAVVINLNPTPIYMSFDTFNLMDFTGVSVRAIPPTAPGTGTGAGAVTTAVTTTPAQIATAAANAHAA